MKNSYDSKRVPVALLQKISFARWYSHESSTEPGLADLFIGSCGWMDFSAASRLIRLSRILFRQRRRLANKEVGGGWRRLGGLEIERFTFTTASYTRGSCRPKRTLSLKLSLKIPCSAPMLWITRCQTVVRWLRRPSYIVRQSHDVVKTCN